jgi:hypothetical protein
MPAPSGLSLVSRETDKGKTETRPSLAEINKDAGKPKFSSRVGILARCILYTLSVLQHLQIYFARREDACEAPLGRPSQQWESSQLVTLLLSSRGFRCCCCFWRQAWDGVSMCSSPEAERHAPNRCPRRVSQPKLSRQRQHCRDSWAPPPPLRERPKRPVSSQSINSAGAHCPSPNQAIESSFLASSH